MIVGIGERRPGSDTIEILVCGFLLHEAEKTKEVLEGRGKNVRLLYFRALAPIDEGTILQAAASGSTLVTLEDHLRRKGLFSIVAELIVSHHLSAHVIPIAFNNRRFKPSRLDEALEYESYAGLHIADRILGELRRAS